ncbi:MAG: GNAT family N-acetyltransferase [Anaerolineae bacterium]|nr:GNAT family N-acetyltransferase [Anaerolineae bacterium]
MQYRRATGNDCLLLAQLNHQLIRDEGHPNPMNVAELENRMRGWLAAAYEGVIFLESENVVAYALYRDDGSQIYLRQFFVARSQRRRGVGRRAMQILFNQVWPKNKRLVVEVLCSNNPGLQFWKSMGFKEYSLSLEILPKQ